MDLGRDLRAGDPMTARRHNWPAFVHAGMFFLGLGVLTVAMVCDRWGRR